MAITRRQYADKAISSAPATKAPPPPGTLLGAHGRQTCAGCGAVVATCPHVGHQYRSAGTVSDCSRCREAR